jgi:hypothetical protein
MGPLSGIAGGVDVSLIVGSVVAGVLYLALTPRQDAPAF